MAGKGTRRRFEISRVEMAGIVVILAMGLVGSFLLGLYAGRGMTDRQRPVAAQVVRLPVVPAVERTPDGEPELTFYETLAPRGQEKGDGRAVAGGTVPQVAPTSSGMKLAASESRDGAEARQGAATTMPPNEDVEPPTRPGTPRAERTPLPAVARVTAAVVPSSVPAPPARGEWSVQVTATRDARTADGLAQRLRSKGYEAYVVKMPRHDGVLYRVRVGHYASLEIANKMVSRLRREPGVPEAFVASD